MRFRKMNKFSSRPSSTKEKTHRKIQKMFKTYNIYKCKAPLDYQAENIALSHKRK